MDGVAAYSALERAWKSLRSREELSVREVACVGAPRTLLCVEIGATNRPAVALSAGVHGDEPAGPWALLSAVDLLPACFSYRLWPCMNPSGYDLGTRANAEGNDVNRSFTRGGQTPEARAIMTANRDRKFLLSLDLHEDFEAEGFYCYEPAAGDEPLGPAILIALDDAGLPIHDLDDAFDLGYTENASHLRSIERGRVIPDIAAETKFFTGLPYSLYVLRHAARQALTLESPRKRTWSERLATHRIALVAALNALACRGELAPPEPN